MGCWAPALALRRNGHRMPVAGRRWLRRGCILPIVPADYAPWSIFASVPPLGRPETMAAAPALKLLKPLAHLHSPSLPSHPQPISVCVSACVCLSPKIYPNTVASPWALTCETAAIVSACLNSASLAWWNTISLRLAIASTLRTSSLRRSTDGCLAYGRSVA